MFYTLNPIDYFDIHSHLHFASYDKDRDEVLDRTLKEKTWMINVGTDKETSEGAVNLAQKYDSGVYASVGLHPIHTDKSFHDKNELGEDEDLSSKGEEFDYDFYKNLANDPKVVAIGECGLDYFHRDTNQRIHTNDTNEMQEEIFRKQIALANEVGKPLMLHVRNPSTSSGQVARSAYFDALEILKEESKVPADFHFFTGSWEEAKEILDAGFFISFTGVLTFTHDYDEVVRNAPLEKIMSETDCPYASPIPFRGKRNEPLYVKEVVEKIAEIRGEDLEKVKKTLVKNALDFFNIHDTNSRIGPASAKASARQVE